MLALAFRNTTAEWAAAGEQVSAVTCSATMRALINEKPWCVCFFVFCFFLFFQAYYPNWTHKDTHWNNTVVTPLVRVLSFGLIERERVRGREEIKPQRGSPSFPFQFGGNGSSELRRVAFKAGKWVTKGDYNTASQIGFYTAVRFWASVKIYNWIKLLNRSFMQTASDIGFL